MTGKKKSICLSTLAKKMKNKKTIKANEFVSEGRKYDRFDKKN